MQATTCDINAYYLDMGINGTVERYQENAMQLLNYQSKSASIKNTTLTYTLKDDSTWG